MAKTRVIGVTSRQKHTRRKLHPAISNSVKAYAQQVGIISWALNNVQANLQAVFCDLIDEDDPATGSAIWHSIKSDDGQRLAVSELAKVKRSLSPRIRDSIVWVADKAGKLAAFRNDAVHTASTLQVDQKGWHIVPSEDWGQPKRVERLARLGHERLFKAAAGDLIQLSAYAERLVLKIWGGGGTLPQRPRLQAVLMTGKTQPQATSRPKRKPKRQSPP